MTLPRRKFLRIFRAHLQVLKQRASNVVFCDIGWSYETLFLSGVRSARFT
jgi:hypothetical protein